MLAALPMSKWDRTTAAHLLNRAGFGGTPSEIDRLEKMGLDRAVSSFVDYESIPDSTGNPSWAKPDPDRAEKAKELMELRRKAKNGSEADRKELEAKFRELMRNQVRSQAQHLVELRRWWLDRMANGPRPLQEKLTLFWHGHFATSVQKVRDAYLMWLQNDTFRRNAAGN